MTKKELAELVWCLKTLEKAEPHPDHGGFEDINEAEAVETILNYITERIFRSEDPAPHDVEHWVMGLTSTFYISRTVHDVDEMAHWGLEPSKPPGQRGRSTRQHSHR